MDNNKLPDKTVERLSQYRRALLNASSGGKQYIFSHEIADLLHLTPVQVRRDIMLIGYSGKLRHGYNVKELIEAVSTIIDTKNKQKVAIVGVGNLGRAIMGYFKGKKSQLSVVAGFDINCDTINKEYTGVVCYSLEEMESIIRKNNIHIAILTVPGHAAEQTAQKLINSGIKGILNFTSHSLQVPSDVYLEEYDMITSLEKIAYFVKSE